MTDPVTHANGGAPRVPLSIAGRPEDTAEWFPITDPAAPRRVIGYAGAATSKQSVRAVEAAHTAWQSWRTLDPDERAARLLAALDRLQTRHSERVDLLVRENGKVRAEAEVELAVFSGRCRLAAQLSGTLNRADELPRLTQRPQPELKPGPTQAHVSAGAAPAFRSRISALALGVVTIIVPYNWPLAILAASLPNAVAQDDRAPFGGFRQSGLGRELGSEGLREFTEAHTVTYPA